MAWDNPFSFAGRIGRARMWLIMIVANLVGVALSVFPVSSRKVVLGTSSSITYAIPLEPVTAESWILLAVFYLITIALYWVVAATMVKRLHDRGRSGKWVAYVFAGLVVFTALEAVLSPLGPAFEIAVVILFMPVAMVGAW